MATETERRLKRIADWQASVGTRQYAHEQYAALVELLLLCEEMLREERTLDRMPLFDVFPLRAIAHVEVFVRLRLKELIDHGPPFLERAGRLAERIKLDHLIASALQSRTVTVGDLLSHEVSISAAGDLIRHFDIVWDGGFKNALAGVVEPWAEQGETAPAILQNVEQTLASLSRLFEIRHKLAHEASYIPPYNPDELPALLSAAATYVTACGELIEQRLHGPIPRTQIEMTARAGEMLERARKELADAIAQARRSGDLDEPQFDVAQTAWSAFAEAEAKLHASLVEGGSAYPMVYADALARLTGERVEQVRHWGQRQEGEM